MPERVVLTPLPDQELLHLAKNVMDDMKIPHKIQVGHDMGKSHVQYEYMSAHEFTTHFCLRFLGRLFFWRRDRKDIHNVRIREEYSGARVRGKWIPLVKDARNV